MSARDALAAARAAGIRLSLDGTRIVLEAGAEPQPPVVQALAKNKPELVELLAAEALTRGTIERVRAGLAGYPADDAEGGEREAIEAEAGLPMVPPELASLGPSVTAAFSSRPDGRVEVRHRRPDGTWSAPTILPPRSATRTAA